MKQTLKYPLDTMVRVMWKDASTRGLWDPIEYYFEHGPANCISIGYVVRHTKDDILLAHTMSTDEQLNGAISIPSVWIQEVDVLVPKRSTKRHVNKKTNKASKANKTKKAKQAR